MNITIIMIKFTNLHLLLGAIVERLRELKLFTFLYRVWFGAQDETFVRT